MLFKYLPVAALLLTTTLSRPLTVNIEIIDDVLTHHGSRLLSLSKNADKAHITGEGVTGGIEVATKLSGDSYGMLERVKSGDDSSMLTAIGGVYYQYKQIKGATAALPRDLPESNATEAVDGYIKLCKSLQAEFDLVVTRKSDLLSFDMLPRMLDFMIEVYADEWDVYTNDLYETLPNIQLKNRMWEYADGPDISMQGALNALRSTAPKLVHQFKLK